MVRRNKFWRKASMVAARLGPLDVLKDSSHLPDMPRGHGKWTPLVRGLPPRELAPPPQAHGESQLQFVMSLSMMYFIIYTLLTTVQKGNQFTNSAHFGV